MHLVLTHRLEQIEAAIEQLNPALSSGPTTVLMHYRRHLIARAKALENAERRRSKLFEAYSEGDLDKSAYETQLAELRQEVQYLEQGKPLAPHKDPAKSWQSWLARLPLLSRFFTPEAQEAPPTVRLPEKIGPRHFTLSLGPGHNWWENGVTAVRLGAWLSLLPLGFFIYVLLTERLFLFLAPDSYFGVLNLVRNLLEEVAFWLTAAFVLGSLYPYLRGSNGAIKGTLLGAVYMAAHGTAMLLSFWLGFGISNTSLFRALQILLYLVTLGVVLDWQTLRRYGFYWQQLLEHYQLRDARNLVAYLSPLALALFTVGQQLLSGQAQAAIAELIKTLPAALSFGG